MSFERPPVGQRPPKTDKQKAWGSTLSVSSKPLKADPEKALKRTSALKRTRKRRQLTSDQMTQATQVVMIRDGRCAYADAWVWMGPMSDRYMVQVSCRGESVYEHAYEQAWLREDLSDPINGTDKEKLRQALTDPRLGRACCREHHDYITAGQLERILPDDFYEALAEYGLTAHWDNRMGKKVVA